MVWTVSQTATTLTLTPDGTTSANLSDLLDLAISTLATTAGVTKPAPFTYQATKKISIGSDASNNFLYVSGLTLIIQDQFIRGTGSRIKFSNLNAAGAVVGKANIILNTNPGGNFNFGGSAFTVNGSNTVSATDLTLSYRRLNTNTGAVVYGTDVSTQSTGDFSNCSFQSDSNGDNSNAIFYFGTETYTNCSFLGWSACEISQPGTLFKNCQFTSVGIVKNSGSGNYYFENITAAVYQLRSGASAFFTDCTVGSLSLDSSSTATNLIDFRNSLQLLGSTNEANGLLVVRFPDNTQIYKRTFSAAGQISGGNSTGATIGVTSSSDRLLVSIFRQTGNPVITAYDCRSLWEGVFVKYGRLPTVFFLNLQGTTATLQNVSFSSLPDTGVTVSNPATVAAYTTIAISHATSLVTISGATTQRQLHDYCALEKASFADSGVTAGGNPVPKACLPTLGSSIYNRPIGTFLYNLSIAAGATLTGSDSVTLAAGKNITLAAVGAYTTSPIGVSSTSIVTVAPGNTDLRGWLFAVGATINVSSTTALVTVSDTTGITAGTGVTLQTPQATIRFHGMPTVSNTILFVQDLTTNVITYPTIASGEAIVTVNAARNYKIRADAPGYLASPFVTISGASVDYQFGLTDYRALYLSGVNRSSQITFNPTTYLITISDLTPTLSFADVFVTIEDYLATPQGLNYTAHPYPVVLSDRNILQFPYDTTTNAVNPARIKPAVGNTTDPALLFETYLERAADPSYGLFDFSTSNGRIIRIRSVVAIAQIASATIAPTSQQIRDALTIPASSTVVAGSIDSKLALIPTIDASISIAAIKTQTDKFVFTTVGRVDATAIGVPTNPLVTTDSRLSNLDALVSSRATQASINALPTLTAIEGSIVLFKSSNYTAPDNAGIGSLNSKLTSARADGLDRLPNLDALITSRATTDQVWAVPYAGLTQTGTIGRLLYWIGKLFGATSTTVTASNTARTTGDGTINQTITTNPDGSKTMSGNP